MITALVSRKGGVGKTTTAVNLASALARLGRRTLLVDLDSQCSATLSLGVGRRDFAPSSADILLGGMPAPEVVRPTPIDGLDLITGSVDLLSADVELGKSGWHRRRLRQALESVAPRYDHVLLDCPPSLSILPQAALVAADTFLVPVVPQFLAVEGVQNLLQSAERLAQRFGSSPEVLGIVLTMVDYRTRETRVQVDRVRRSFGDLVFAVEIRINVRLAEAPAAGRTIFDYAPQSTGARAYGLLGEELLMRIGARPRPAPEQGEAADTDPDGASGTEPDPATGDEPPAAPPAGDGDRTAAEPENEAAAEPVPWPATEAPDEPRP